MQWFFDSITGFDMLCRVAHDDPRGELKGGDLLFRRGKDFEGDGFIYEIQIAGEETPFYCRLYLEENTYAAYITGSGTLYGKFPVEDVTIRGKVIGVYRNLPTVNKEASQERGEYGPMLDKIKDQTKDVDAGRYDVNCEEIEALRMMIKYDGFGAIYQAFRYGFLRGQRCEANRAKCEARKQRTGVAI